MNDWYDGPRKYESDDSNTLPPPTPGERALAELAKLPPVEAPGEPTQLACPLCRLIGEHAPSCLERAAEEGLEGVDGDIVPEPSDWEKARAEQRKRRFCGQIQPHFAHDGCSGYAGQQ